MVNKNALVIALGFLSMAFASPAAFAVGACLGTGVISNRVDPSFSCNQKAAEAIVNDCTAKNSTAKITPVQLEAGKFSFFVNWHRDSSDGAGFYDHNGVYHMFSIIKLDSKTCDLVEVGGTECEFIGDRAVVGNPYANLPASFSSMCQ